MLEDNFQRHILNDTLTPFERMLHRFRLDLGACPRFSMFRHLRGSSHFEIALLADACQQLLALLRDDELVHGFESLERVFAVKDSGLVNVTIFREQDSPT